MKRTFRLAISAGALALLVASPATSGIILYEEGDRKLEVGGRIQLQYLNFETDGLMDAGEDADVSFDKLNFRRLRPYIAGTVTKDWYAKIQFDFGKSEDADEIAVKDAYMQYRGIKNHKLTIGNSKTPFSREFLTSSKRQQLIERSFAGDHNFGSPDRQLGLRMEGHFAEKHFTWMGAVGAQEHDPAINRMDFDTPVNRSADWNEGWLVAARIDWHPLGFVAFDQGNFHTDEWKFNVSLAAYLWDNDDDNNTYTNADGTAIDPAGDKQDLDSADGIEVSAGVRGYGFSADVEYQLISGDLVASDVTGANGLYLDGTTDLDLLAVEGGYMLPNNRIEFVAGWDSIDADGYGDAWSRTKVGVNWFWNQHKAKLQASYRMSDNYLGQVDVDADAFTMQAQFVF